MANLAMEKRIPFFHVGLSVFRISVLPKHLRMTHRAPAQTSLKVRAINLLKNVQNVLTVLPDKV
jgi:hypothetical protein